MSPPPTDDGRFASWWLSVDRVLLIAILVLVGIGIVVSLAASPAVAIKKGFAPFHFVERHLLFAVMGVGVMLAISMLSPQGVRRLALALLAAGIAGLIAVHFTGAEINGARRWLRLGSFTLQPSEFVKPALAVVLGWLFAETRRNPDMPALLLSVLIGMTVATLLVMQPDVGQTLLVTAMWGALYLLSGQPLMGAVLLGALGLGGLISAYAAFPHVQSRIDRFFSPASGDNSQVGRAMQSFSEGGFFGRGPGEGTIKTILPDAHTDFILAVVAEEYGVVACLGLLVLFALIVARSLARAGREADPATRLAIDGLALVFGLQALINMGVNVGLLPAKGMTLPFISAGGSSTLAVSVTLGMLLALTRRRADPVRLNSPALLGTLGVAGEGGYGARRGRSSS